VSPPGKTYRARIEPAGGNVLAIVIHFEASNIVDAVTTVMDFCAPHGYTANDVVHLVDTESNRLVQRN
jgi:hypothetical protein